MIYVIESQKFTDNVSENWEFKSVGSNASQRFTANVDASQRFTTDGKRANWRFPGSQRFKVEDLQNQKSKVKNGVDKIFTTNVSKS